MVRIQSLNLYPVKSARALPLTRWPIASGGLAWDRHWMVVNGEGMFLTQRVQSRLAWIAPELTEEALILRAPALSLPELRVSLAPEGPEVPVRVWRHEGMALDVGAEAAAWLSIVLGQAVRLVRVSPQHTRVADPQFAGDTPAPIAFPDGFPVLVCNQASLEALNAQLPQPIPMARFRPNVVLEGLPPFAEDRIEAVQLAGVTLKLVKPCTRCVITSLDPLTGEASTNPLGLLRELRYDPALHGVTFGENAVVRAEAGATLAQGAECTVVYEDG